MNTTMHSWLASGVSQTRVGWEPNAIKAAHAEAADAVKAWTSAKNLALATHTNYVAALKLWTPARDLTAKARALAYEGIDQTIAYPNAYDQSWLAWLSAYGTNDTSILAELGAGLAALKADMAAHLKLSQPSVAAPKRAPVPTIIPRPNGSSTVADPTGSVDIAPDGEVTDNNAGLFGLTGISLYAVLGGTAYGIWWVARKVMR
jgi:hypothetical protein